MAGSGLEGPALDQALPLRAAGTDLRRPLRAGASHETLLNLVRALWEGRADRGAEERRGVRDRGAYIPVSVLRKDAHLEMHTRGG